MDGGVLNGEVWNGLASHTIRNTKDSHLCVNTQYDKANLNNIIHTDRAWTICSKRG